MTADSSSGSPRNRERSMTKSKAEERSTPVLGSATENSTARTEAPASNPFLANRLAMAIKRAKGRCEARFPLGNDCHTRCIGRDVGPFYTTDNRVRMLCEECWEAQADYQQRSVARRWMPEPGSETK